MRLFSKRNFRLLSVKRKAKAKNNSPDSQEPTFNLLVAAKGEARGRAKPSVANWVFLTGNELSAGMGVGKWG